MLRRRAPRRVLPAVRGQAGAVVPLHRPAGGRFLCYRLSELEAGRPTVFVVAHHPTADSPVTRAADSLLAGLHAHHTAHLAWLEKEERATASHSGGGTVTEESLSVAEGFLLEIDDLRRRLAGPR